MVRHCEQTWTRETSAAGHRRGHKARPRQSKQSRQSKSGRQQPTTLPHASQGSMPERESQARAGAYWRRRSYACRRAVQIAARARARGSPRTGRPAGLERSAWPGKGSPRSEARGLELRRRRGCFWSRRRTKRLSETQRTQIGLSRVRAYGFSRGARLYRLGGYVPSFLQKKFI
jgi:hypothetical protein